MDADLVIAPSSCASFSSCKCERGPFGICDGCHPTEWHQIIVDVCPKQTDYCAVPPRVRHACCPSNPRRTQPIHGQPCVRVRRAQLVLVRRRNGEVCRLPCLWQRCATIHGFHDLARTHVCSTSSACLHVTFVSCSVRHSFLGVVFSLL